MELSVIVYQSGASPCENRGPKYSTGDLKGLSSFPVNGNWRLTFAFEGCDAILVDYQDYH